MTGRLCGHPYAHDDPRAADLVSYNPQNPGSVDHCAPIGYYSRVEHNSLYAYVIRVPSDNFMADAVEVLDLTSPDCPEVTYSDWPVRRVCGYIGSGFTDGVHGYLLQGS